MNEFIPGTASWNDAFNNKAFLAGEVHWTNNGVSIYAAAKAQNMKEMADDIDHALWPVGPVGKPTEFHIAYPIMIMTYSKFPQASKAFIAFMMEAAQPRSVGREIGRLSHAGPHGLREEPRVDSDPKLTVVSRRRQGHAHRRPSRLGR